jgi:TPR repeat protein
MSLVGRCCEEGWGRPRDAALAASWYERSANAGYFRGQYNWATQLLEAGRVDEATQWLERAAHSGTAGVKQAVSQLAARHASHPAMRALLKRLG